MKARPLGTRPAARFEPLEGRLLFAAGDVDLAFGGGDGVATGAPPDWVGRAMAVAADGSVVAAGSPPPTADGFPGEGFALVRYTPGGAIDPSFSPGGADGDGRVVTAGFPAFGATRVAVAPDGSIVAAGPAQSNGEPGSAGAALIRYLADGSPDAGFGDGGVVTARFGSLARPLAVQFEAGGKILLGVFVESPVSAYYAVSRFNADGSPDASYGTGGTARGTLPVDDGGLSQVQPFDAWVPDPFAAGPAHLAHAQDSAVAAVRQPDGKILALATAYAADATRALHTAVLRFGADGSLDPSFAHSVHAPAAADLRSVFLQPGTGRILFGAGERSSTPPAWRCPRRGHSARSRSTSPPTRPTLRWAR